MKYLALIYSSEKEEQSRGEKYQQDVFNEYMAFEGWLAKERPGKKVAGDALQPSTTATTIRIRDGKRTVTDGPFAETREQLGGYYIFEAENLDEAIELAARIPTAKIGSIEVRPIMVFEGMPG